MNNMPDLPETKQLHKDMLVLLQMFDDICRKNGIRYSLHGGTLLGCIRDKGFIPWDDDIDVSMTREEYKKLKDVFEQTAFNDKFYLDYTTNRCPQLWLKQENRQPVWLDIFIWDFISEKIIPQKMKIVGLSFFLAFLKTERTMKLSTESKKYTGLKHLLILVGYGLGKLFSTDKKLQWADSFSKRITGSRILINRSNDLYAGMVIILSKEVMDNYEDREFEGKKLMVSSSYHDILTSSYGEDYLIPRKMSVNEKNTHSMARKTI